MSAESVGNNTWDKPSSEYFTRALGYLIERLVSLLAAIFLTLHNLLLFLHAAPGWMVVDNNSSRVELYGT